MTAMKRIVLSFALAAGLGVADDRYNPRRHQADPVSQTLRDVQYVWSRSRVDGHESGHFRKVVDSLQRFQDQASRGRFDRGRLDRAIDNLDDLAQADQIHPESRRLLRQRLHDLRGLREGGGRYW